MSNRFVFVTPYFNCFEDIEKTVFSMLAQSYDNWRAILIDDMSTDGSAELVTKLCERLPKRHRDRFSLVSTEFKHGEVRNTLESIKSIDDEEVICRVDGGDWLIENDILYVLNQVYSDPTVAVAWTAHRWSYTNRNISGPMNLVQGQTVYQHPWVSSHMKTARCKHIKSVPDKNFRDDDGNYIMIACDQAVFLPTMHVAKEHGFNLQFIPMCAYHYNIDLSNKNLFTCDRSIKQKTSAETIRARGFLQ
jgi:glycosyltransferase involved in cell wall biosynthesis